MTERVLVACIGNSLVADDAAGYWVFGDLGSRQLPSNLKLEHLGLGGISLLDHLEGESTLLVVDAVRFGSEVGTVHVLEWGQLPKARPAISVHGIGIREAIELGRALEPERMPKRVVLIGIEGECFDGLGEAPCEAVQRAIPRASAAVLGIVEAIRDRGERP